MLCKPLKIKISVIIPVYNAATFITDCVESALEQPETSEVILVKDGSMDDSLEICQSLANKFGKVRLLCHPDGVNRGPAACRNLGMRHSNFDMIALLDADDFFLPGRFTTAEEIFKLNPGCEGVYEAVGTAYTDEHTERRWRASSETANTLTSLGEKVEPGELFQFLVKRGPARIHVDGLTFKRAALDKAGFMNETLGTMSEDTDFILRLAGVCSLHSGRLQEPVAMRRVHSGNTFWKRGSETKIYRGSQKSLKIT